MVDRSKAMDFPSGGLASDSKGADASLAQGLVKQDSSKQGLLQTGIQQIGDLGPIPSSSTTGVYGAKKS